MKKYIIRRLIHLIPVLLGITFLTFALTYLSPGDPAELMLSATGITPSPELIQQVRGEMGLDKPFLIQYLNWLTFLTPVFGAILSALLLGESILEIKNLTALVLACTGIWIVNRK